MSVIRFRYTEQNLFLFEIRRGFLENLFSHDTLRFIIREQKYGRVPLLENFFDSPIVEGHDVRERVFFYESFQVCGCEVTGKSVSLFIELFEHDDLALRGSEFLEVPFNEISCEWNFLISHGHTLEDSIFFIFDGGPEINCKDIFFIDCSLKFLCIFVISRHGARPLFQPTNYFIFRSTTVILDVVTGCEKFKCWVPLY